MCPEERLRQVISDRLVKIASTGADFKGLISAETERHRETPSYRRTTELRIIG
jgi:hypothetical protein